jgi:hypothetical protein
MSTPARPKPVVPVPTGCGSARGSDTIADSPFWFCIRTQPRRELFALSFLKQLDNVQSFFPRIRFRGAGAAR